MTAGIDDLPATVFDPPVRVVECTASGNIVFTLSGDSTSTPALKRTKAMVAGGVLRDYEIGKIWLTGTTAGFVTSE